VYAERLITSDYIHELESDCHRLTSDLEQRTRERDATTGDNAVMITTALLAELQRLREVVAKLPRTADGVPVTPGAELYVIADRADRLATIADVMKFKVMRDDSDYCWYSTVDAAWQAYSQEHPSSPAGSEVQSCGHPVWAIVSDPDGTCYCRQCDAEAREANQQKGGGA
jgi:hypothetical protein